MNGIQEVRGSIPLTSTRDIKLFIGIDICSGRYALALLTAKEWHIVSLEISVITSLPLALLRQSELAFIDVPIGLSETPMPRTCDILLRKAIGNRGSSVFYVPCRKVVYAPNPELEHQNLTGKRIQRQALGLLRAIKEVDELVRGNKDLSEKLLESHPELCFQILNEGRALRFRKKTEEGVNERVSILERYGLQRDYLLQMAKTKSVAHDFNDAGCLALCAFLSSHGISRIPETEERDSAGLRMQVHFPSLPGT